MKKSILLPLFALVVSYISAQTEATTIDGKKVILYENGTWKPAEATPVVTNENTISDCSKYISKEVDKVTGESSTSSKDMILISSDGEKSGFGIYIFSTAKNEIIFSIQAVGAGNCIDDDNKMNVLFRDGTRLELINDGKFNCDAKYTQYFGGIFGKRKELEMFRTKEVETIRIWTSKGYVEEDFTPDQSKLFIKTIDCLIHN